MDFREASRWKIPLGKQKKKKSNIIHQGMREWKKRWSSSSSRSELDVYYTHRTIHSHLVISLLSLFELSFSSADESRLKKRKEHFRLTAMGPTSHRPAAIGYALSPKKTFPKKYKKYKKKPVGAEREVNNNSISTENSSIYHAHTPARRPACVSSQVFFQKIKIKRWKILI